MQSKFEQELSFSSNKKHTVKLKIVFVGDQSVGKSSIINRFIKNEFDSANNPTIGIDFVSKNIVVKARSIRLQLWDTAGQQRFKSLIPGYLRDSHGIFIVYDITSRQSFDNLDRWVDYTKQHRGCDVPIFIIGNKKDQEDIRIVDYNEAKKKCQDIGAFFTEASAKTGENLQKLFNQACEQLVKSPVLETSVNTVESLKDKLKTPNLTLQKQRSIKKQPKTQAQKGVKSANTKDKEIRGQKLVVKPNGSYLKQKNCC